MMLQLPTDYSVIGTVLAVSVAILLLSGLALYVAFRLREAFKEERGGGARAAKVAFLIGLLFLSGGVFYFFASGFNAQGNGTTSTIQTSSTGTSSSSTSSSTITSTSTSSSSSTTGTTTSSTSTTSTSSSSTTAAGSVSMPAPTCPSRVTAGTTFTCTIYVNNQGGATYNSSTIVSSGDFSKFTFLGCTKSVNGGTASAVPTSSNTISVGSLPPGTTVLTLTVQAPSQSGQDSNSVLTFNAPGLPQPISVTFAIQVTA